ncbi:MAG TPA: T9SS type A sorting domain-containing protein, partial [Flavobacterium sp.]|nr:T9SS type A sorting domain-containing protein [Flavobacterium sp.]
DPCANILGSLLVKTRSSGGSLTSELKDFVGPFPFGNTETPPEINPTSLTDCSNSDNTQTFNLKSRVAAALLDKVKFYLSEADRTAEVNAISLGDLETYPVLASTTPTTFYLRANTSFLGCFSTAEFTIKVNATPLLDPVNPITRCDSYTLPALGTITGTNLVSPKYYNNSQANGVTEITDLVLTTSQTVWIYDETGTDPNCSVETSFMVTINKSPSLDPVNPVTQCDSYTLPAVGTITGTNLVSPKYYNNSQANGGTVITDLVLTSSQTVWIYDETGTDPNCSDETSFVVTVEPCGYGCTPGFWQGGKGKTLWDNSNDQIAQAVGFTTNTLLSTVLPGVEGKCGIPTGLKMVDAITLGGGNCQKLMRHGVAAILNATTLAEYPLPDGITVDGLKQAIIDAVNNNCGCEPLASQLAMNNELNHDLCGTITTEVIDQLKTNAELNTTAKSNEVSSFTASPVPFRDQLTVSYDFKFVTDVTIEVFNTSGAVVAKNYETNGHLNKSALLNIPYTGQEEVYVIKVTTNRGSSTKKVISSR